MPHARRLRIAEPLSEDFARKLWKEVSRIVERDSPTNQGKTLVGVEVFMFDGSAHVYANVIKREPRGDRIYLKVLEVGDPSEEIPF